MIKDISLTEQELGLQLGSRLNMEITVKLGSALNEFRPDGQTTQTFPYEADNNATVTDLIRALGIPDDHGLLVIVNGTLVRADQRNNTVLKQNDALSLMPPIHAG